MSHNPPNARPRLLVIDDDPLLTDLLAVVLGEVGVVDIANSGSQGLESARRLQPDLILLDVQMPGEDGFDVISELKADPSVRHIPVIFITADTLPEIESHCLESGAADYIAKPVNPRVLLARARTHILLKQQADALASLAWHDGLTGATNRRAFDEALERECGRAARSRVDLSLLLIDVDHFKAYNDSYGHVAGDEVLTAIVASTRGVIRHPADIVARVGGKEFAVLLPDTSPDVASLLAKRIDIAITDLAIRHTGAPAQAVSVSIGVASYAESSDAEGLMGRANEHLCAAKSAGRFTVVAR